MRGQMHHLDLTVSDIGRSKPFYENADSRQDVDRPHERLVAAGVTILDAPAEYPQYGTGYYAVFFADPDGMKLEYVHHTGQA